MAFSVDLVNVNPRGAVRLTVDGESVEVDAGGPLTVTPETAGEAPHWRQATEADAAELAANPAAVHYRERAGKLEVFDLGSGLLAQTENWRAKGHEDDDPADPLADGHGGQLEPAPVMAPLISDRTGAEPPAAAPDAGAATTGTEHS